MSQAEEKLLPLPEHLTLPTVIDEAVLAIFVFVHVHCLTSLQG